MSEFKIEFEETIEGDFLYLWQPIVNGYKESPCINGKKVVRFDGSFYIVYGFMGRLYDTLPQAKAEATAYFKA